MKGRENIKGRHAMMMRMGKGMDLPTRSLMFLAARVAIIATIPRSVPVTPKMIARMVSSGT